LIWTIIKTYLANLHHYFHGFNGTLELQFGHIAKVR